MQPIPATAPRRKRRTPLYIAVALLVVGALGTWWWLNRPAGIVAITIWLPDGRPVTVPRDTPEFDALAGAVTGIVSFAPSVARRTYLANESPGALSPAWRTNADAVCVEAVYDRALAGQAGSSADRVVIGDVGDRLSEHFPIVGIGPWADGRWIEYSVGINFPPSRTKALGRATETALQRLHPADAPTIPAPANTAARMVQPVASTLDPMPGEVWDGMAFHLGTPLSRAGAWEATTTPAISAGSAILECRFKLPVALTDGAGGQWRMRAIHFAWLKDARHGVSWVETDRGIYRWRAEHIYKPLELYLWRAGTYGPGVTAPHDGQ